MLLAPSCLRAQTSVLMAFVHHTLDSGTSPSVPRSTRSPPPYYYPAPSVTAPSGTGGQYASRPHRRSTCHSNARPRPVLRLPSILSEGNAGATHGSPVGI